MAAGLAISVTDWMAWAPGRESRDAWRHWARAGEAAARTPVDAMPPPGSGETNRSDLVALPAMLRRRCGQLGRAALGTALACGEVSRARYVVSSRHGDLGLTAGLLESLAADQPLSPADFSLSVHHVVAGLLSIHAGDRLGHTAVAAGPDSFGFGFLEAACCALENPETPALLIYCDLQPPAPYQQLPIEDDPALPIVLAVQLEAESAAGTRLSFRALPRDARDGAAPDATDIEPVSVPTSAAETFLRHLLTDAATVVSPGERMTWRWTRDA